jgi:hypothetical protein
MDHGSDDLTCLVLYAPSNPGRTRSRRSDLVNDLKFTMPRGLKVSQRLVGDASHNTPESVDGTTGLNEQNGSSTALATSWSGFRVEMLSDVHTSNT